MALLSALGLGLNLLSGLARAKGEKKAKKTEYEAQKKAHEAGQARRGGRLDAIQSAIGSVGGALPQGAPSYQIDPAALERLKAAIPFAQGDPTKGSTWAMLSGLAKGAGDVLGTASMARGMPGGGGVESQQFDPGQIGRTPNFNPALGAGMFQQGPCPPGEIC